MIGMAGVLAYAGLGYFEINKIFGCELGVVIEKRLKQKGKKVK